MSLYTQWTDLANEERPQKDNELFWTNYLKEEKENYEIILKNPSNIIKGSVSQLASHFKMDTLVFVGFLDGINSSLTQELNLDDLQEDTLIELNIDFEKLYYNMLDASATWLYGLPEWDAILSEEKRKEIKKDFNQTKTVVKEEKIGRNDLCPCGSGKKYKKCCLNK